MHKSPHVGVTPAAYDRIKKYCKAKKLTMKSVVCDLVKNADLSNIPSKVEPGRTPVKLIIVDHTTRETVRGFRKEDCVTQKFAVSNLILNNIPETKPARKKSKAA